MKLRTQLLLLQLVIMLVTVVGTGIVASWLQEQQLRDAYRDRMVAVAQSIAALPAIADAFDDANPSATIQPIAEVVREASDLTYVVVTDSEGIRFSHPNPAEIGERVSTDPSSVLAGKPYFGTQTGTLGTTWRVKLPIFGADNEVIGIVSVGILESELQSDYLANATLLFVTIGLATVLGVIGAAWISVLIRRRIYGLEPEEIAALLEAREAMLHGVREGIVAVDNSGRIALLNDAAARLLNIESSQDAIGLSAQEVLESDLAALVEGGEIEQKLVLSGERILIVRRDQATIDGKPIGILLILRDNTELHALLRDLDGAQGLADGLRSQAHGFANKLHIISGLLELGHTSEAVAFIERVGSGGTLESVTGTTGIKDLEVAALLLMKQMTARELGTVVKTDPQSAISGPVAEVLRDDLLTVLGNLLDNAIEACGTEGAVTVSVKVEGTHEGGSEVVVRVADNGSGVPVDLRDLVFDPGYSSKSATLARISTGRGIGLTLVKRISARHKGSVWITDAVDGGAVVTVRLPFGEQSASLTPHNSAAGAKQ